MPAADSSPSALLKAATPDLYRRNAFRLTGLMVTASAREVARQADKLKMLAEVGGHAAQQLTVLPGAQPPTPDEVREAVQKLKDLEARAVDEFFWFWPQDWENPDADAALSALKRNDLDAAFALWVQREAGEECPIASHNLAVLFHMRALEWAGIELQEVLSAADRETQVKYWRESFDRWEWLAGDDRLWDAFKSRIRQVNDVALTTGFARRLKNELPKAFDQVNAQLALQFARQERAMETEWHVEFLQSTHAGDDDSEGTLDAVLVPVRQSLERHMESAEAALRRDKKDGLSHARKLVSATLPLHHTCALILGEDHSEVIEIGDSIAGAALTSCVTGYNRSMEAAGEAGGTAKTANADAFVSVLNDILPLATDPELSRRIRVNLKTARTNHGFDTQVRPLMDRLLAISEMRETPETKLDSIRREILPKLDGLLAAQALPAEQVNELCDKVAMLIRRLGIEDNNAYGRISVVREALQTALKYVRDAKLKSQLLEDRHMVTGNNQPTNQPRMAVGSLGLDPITPDYEREDGGFLSWFWESIPSKIQEFIVLGVVIGGLAFIGVLFSKCSENDTSPVPNHKSETVSQRPKKTPVSQRTHAPHQPLVELLMPTTGILQPASATYRTGPLTISTRYGSGNFYVKLVNESTRSTVMTLFIRDGQTITDVDVPSGTYEMRYACGDKWYGTTDLFGEGTSYNKADSSFTFSDGSGYKVELYKQQFGNLPTHEINKDNF